MMTKEIPQLRKVSDEVLGKGSQSDMLTRKWSACVRAKDPATYEKSKKELVATLQEIGKEKTEQLVKKVSEKSDEMDRGKFKKLLQIGRRTIYAAIGVVLLEYASGMLDSNDPIVTGLVVASTVMVVVPLGALVVVLYSLYQEQVIGGLRLLGKMTEKNESKGGG